MKEIIAVIRPGRARLTKQKLAENGFIAWTEARVLGRGKQKGLQYSNASENSHAQGGISFLAKRMLTFFVNDEAFEKVVALLVEVNKTGEIGDGKIFVCRAEDAVRIRTDERGCAALV